MSLGANRLVSPVLEVTGLQPNILGFGSSAAEDVTCFLHEYQ